MALGDNNIKQGWRVGRSQNGDEVRWLPVATFSRGEHLAPLTVGISIEDVWLIDGGMGALVKLETSLADVGAFPLLEMKLPEVFAAITDGLLESGLSAEALARLPVTRIVSSALRSPSQHWPSDALNWAELLPVDDDMEDALTWLASKGTQPQRHAAMRILRKSRRVSRR